MDQDGTAGFHPALLDAGQPTPLYHQIYLILAERIRTGAFSNGSMLPGEQELARLFNVSRITVKRAMNELAADGLISRHRGRGSRVNARPATPIVRGSFFNLIESLKQMGAETQVKLLEAAEIEAEPSVAKLLELPPGARVQRSVRMRSVNGEPFSHLLAYVPADIAARYSRRELAKTPLLTLLERAGAHLQDAELWISSVSAPTPVASLLGVPSASPLLRIERVLRDDRGRPVELIYAHYRSDRFHYHVKTSRRRGRGASWKAKG